MIWIPLLAIFLSGCGLFAGGCVAAGTAFGLYKLSGSGGPKGFLKDIDLEKRINKAVKLDKLPPVKLLVLDGNVMLSGHLKSSQQHIKLISHIAGVRRVIDRTQQVALTDVNAPRDVFLSTKIKSQLLLNIYVQSRNLVIKVHDGVVYVLGVVSSHEEKARIMRSLLEIEGVRRVETHLHVRD